MTRQNKTKYAVLGLLSQQPCSGYDIKKVFERYMGEFWSESYGQIYPTTKSLVEEGCSTCTVERTEGKPDRHIFSITEKGMEELRNWLNQPTEPHQERLEVLLKLVFGTHMSIEENIRLIERFRDQWSKHIKRCEEITSTLNTEFEGNLHLPYMRMSVSCGMHVGNAYIAWCDETIAAIKAMDHGLSEQQSEQGDGQ